MDMRLRFCDSPNEHSGIKPPGPPTLAGARCIHELRKRSAFDDVPIVVCSVISNEMIQDALGGTDLREFQFVDKPIDYFYLKEVLRSLLAASVPLPQPKKKDVVSRI